MNKLVSFGIGLVIGFLICLFISRGENNADYINSDVYYDSTGMSIFYEPIPDTNIVIDTNDVYKYITKYNIIDSVIYKDSTGIIIDTSSIVTAYLSSRGYSDTIRDDSSMFVLVMDTIGFNQILSRRVITKNRRATKRVNKFYNSDYKIGAAISTGSHVKFNVSRKINKSSYIGLSYSRDMNDGSNAIWINYDYFFNL